MWIHSLAFDWPSQRPRMEDLGRRLLEILQEEPQPVLRRRQREVGVLSIAAPHARSACKGLLFHMLSKSHLESRNQRRKLLHGQAG
jgi:hypothetical protein